MSTEATTPGGQEEAPPQAQTPPPALPPPTKRPWKLIAIVIVGLILLLKGVPWIWRALHTVSTDDAYVNSYVTFVAPRVPGQVARVLVEDNNRVKKRGCACGTRRRTVSNGGRNQTSIS